MGRRLGLTTFRDPSRYDLSLTLGGGEIRLLDLTAAYAAFAIAGVRVDPVAVLRVEDSAGDILYEAPASSRERVVSPQTAYLISDILSDNDARAPAFGLNSPLRLDRPAAAKTGTTSDFRDNWTVGYTPQLAVGVWVGNSDNSPMRNVSGVDGAAPIWRDVMQTALKGTAPEGFTEPEGIERASVCLPSGLLPTPYCQRQRTEVFTAGTAPTAQDDYYRPVLVCDATGQAVTPGDTSCPDSASERVFTFVPLEAIPWAREAGIALPPLPPYTTGRGGSPGAQRVSDSAGLGLRLTSPADGAVFHLSRELGPEDQTLRIEALPATPVRYVELYVDDAPIARVDAGPYRTWWSPTPGSHQVRARAVDLDENETWTETANVAVLPP